MGIGIFGLDFSDNDFRARDIGKAIKIDSYIFLGSGKLPLKKPDKLEKANLYARNCRHNEKVSPMGLKMVYNVYQKVFEHCTFTFISAGIFQD